MATNSRTDALARSSTLLGVRPGRCLAARYARARAMHAANTADLQRRACADTGMQPPYCAVVLYSGARCEGQQKVNKPRGFVTIACIKEL